ncbi:MAG TPA: type II toxin-antitoxin system PemK/MazF family toxin [Patescibacteria group bacterium]|nr:type II toxin-antitoxin system PemK/MazF family toxin [Patescibacteria group bacterium]
MIRSGQLALLSFPQTDQAVGRLRPTLVLCPLPGPYDDWLVCMISSQLRHEVTGIDEVVREADPDFADTGLKTASVIRVTRIAVVSADILHGTIGKLNEERLTRIRTRVADWILGASGTSDGEEATNAEQADPRDKT